MTVWLFRDAKPLARRSQRKLISDTRRSAHRQRDILHPLDGEESDPLMQVIKDGLNSAHQQRYDRLAQESCP
jgi:hypothetical protein